MNSKTESDHLTTLLRSIQTPLDIAVTEINKRKQNAHLKNEIVKFLQDDIPDHFNTGQPIFYLSRYIATPDYETLHFYKQVKSHQWPIVIGVDNKDIFTSHNSLKRNLLKLPIVSGLSKDGMGIVAYINISDFNAHQGKKLRDITLKDGSRLLDFHRNLCEMFLPKNISVVDESDWVDRNKRGKLIALYERLLPLFITHGIMLEQYEPNEIEFLETVVVPAWERTKSRFGHTPLIAPLTLKYSKEINDLNSYPPEIGTYIYKVLQQ